MIDLQLHTKDSDGTWPWDKVLDHCLSMKLSAFSITDHDTMVRHKEIRQWAIDHNALAIPGVELSTKDKGHTVHLLGYFCEGPTDHLQERLEMLQKGRKHRNGKIIDRLQRLGFDVTEEELNEISGKGSPGRPHIARLLMNKGHVKSIQEAFDKYLGTDGAAYIALARLSLREAIDLLHGAGAVTSLAHPILLHVDPEELEALLKEWRSWGLDAVETYYPTYKKEQTAFMERMATKYGFLRTGGSDFHGENKPHIKIGVGMGSLNVPDALVAPLMQRKEEILRDIK